MPTDCYLTGKKQEFSSWILEKLQSKWVADHNLSNHLERNRFGAFCQLVCTKCHQCAKANAATNVAPCGEKNASERCVDITSKWVADYNLSNHLERKRFGAFCQLVCTKCHQCAKANAATNVAPFGVKNASKG